VRCNQTLCEILNSGPLSKNHWKPDEYSSPYSETTLANRTVRRDRTGYGSRNDHSLLIFWGYRTYRPFSFVEFWWTECCCRQFPKRVWLIHVIDNSSLITQLSDWSTTWCDHLALKSIINWRMTAFKIDIGSQAPFWNLERNGLSETVLFDDRYYCVYSLSINAVQKHEYEYR
jgi:hypothetical protein